MYQEIDEEKVWEEFQQALADAIGIYQSVKNISYPALNIFIQDKVWKSLEKYNRMEIKTKEKFFENLYKNTSIDEYSKGVYELWGNIDHSYMDRDIKELQKMVIQRDFKNQEMYSNKKITTRSIKLENYWRDFTLSKEDFYSLNPTRDFKTIEERYINRHIKLYKNTLNRFKNSKDLANDLANFMKKYDQLDRSVPYFSHSTGKIIRYVDVGTYNSMLYNVNLTRSAWNRTFYDAKLFGDNLFYLRPHMYSCPECAEYQGYVYANNQYTPQEQITLLRYGKPGEWYIDDAIAGHVGHPNCKHVWLPYFSEEQIQEDRYNNEEWDEKYEIKQKIQSLDLKKSRLLGDRRIYKELGQQDLVDKTTSKIKAIREKKKELEALM